MCDLAQFPSKGNPNSAKSNCIFPGKGREDRAVILTYLESPIDKLFLEKSKILLIFKV